MKYGFGDTLFGGVAFLKRGYRYLIRENAALRRQIENMRGRPAAGNDRANTVISEGVRRRNGFSRKNYFLYIKELFFGSSVYYTLRNICHTFRPAMYLWQTVKIATVFFAYVKSSAVFLISVLLLLCTIPFFLIITASQTMFVIFSGNRTRKRIEQSISGGKIAVFFQPKHGSVLDGTAGMLSERGYTVFCVFGALDFRCKGFGFLTGVSSAGNNVFNIRAYYYFFLKKTFKTKCDKVVYIY